MLDWSRNLQNVDDDDDANESCFEATTVMLMQDVHTPLNVDKPKLEDNVDDDDRSVQQSNEDSNGST